MSITEVLRTLLGRRQTVATPTERTVFSLRPTVYMPSSAIDRFRDSIAERVMQGRAGATEGTGRGPLCCA